jgi:uncharacterized membrane protein YkoI
MMMRRYARFWTISAAIVCGLSLMHATARDEHRRTDHEVARQALLRGEIMSLEAVLVEVRKTYQGEFVGVELEFKHGLWVYGIKLLTPDQKLTRIRVDARTGKPLPAKKEQD